MKFLDQIREKRSFIKTLEAITAGQPQTTSDETVNDKILREIRPHQTFTREADINITSIGGTYEITIRSRRGEKFLDSPARNILMCMGDVFDIANYERYPPIRDVIYSLADEDYLTIKADHGSLSVLAELCAIAAQGVVNDPNRSSRSKRMAELLQKRYPDVPETPAQEHNAPSSDRPRPGRSLRGWNR